jgi:hypothetical protein
MSRGWNPNGAAPLSAQDTYGEKTIMTFGKGALLWLIGIPLPIILLLALFWR